jgi:hypothetical protein
VLGVEDDLTAADLDVDRPARVAVLAAVGNQRIGLLLPLPGRLEIGQRSFQRVEAGRHAYQGCPRRLGLLVLFVGDGLLGGDRLHSFIQTGLFGVKLAAQRLHVFLSGADSCLGGAGLLSECGDLRLDLTDFVFELRVQALTAALPLRLPGRHALNVLVHQLGQFLLGLGARNGLGPAIDDQQHQDQRPHRAQEHGQEGERGNLENVAPASHAAIPGLPLAAGT